MASIACRLLELLYFTINLIDNEKKKSLNLGIFLNGNCASTINANSVFKKQCKNNGCIKIKEKDTH